MGIGVETAEDDEGAIDAEGTKYNQVAPPKSLLTEVGVRLFVLALRRAMLSALHLMSYRSRLRSNRKASGL